MARRIRNKRFKVALGILFFIILGVIFLMNREPINSLIPFNDPIDPWPLKQECDLPALKDKAGQANQADEAMKDVRQ